MWFLLKSLVDEPDRKEIWNVIKNGRGISCDKFFWCFYGCEKWDVEMSHLWNFKTCFFNGILIICNLIGWEFHKIRKN